MRQFLVIAILGIFTSIAVKAQNFQYSENLTVSEITESDFLKYFGTREEPRYDYRSAGSDLVRMEELLHGSHLDIHLDSVWDGYKGEKRYLGYYEFTDSYDARRFLIVTCEPIHERAYLLDENFKADSISMFGEGELDNNLVFCAHKDFDCDESVWCKWYSVGTGHVVNIASFKDLSFGYFVPNLEQCSNPFPDNKGHYFLCVQNKASGLRKYYKIGLEADSCLH